jgi:hypothetical protein
MAHYVGPRDSRATNNHVELKRTDGSITVLRIVWRMLPRNGRRALLLVCSYSYTPRRYVYGSWEWGQLFGMVEQSQEYQLAVPVLSSAALLF